MDISAVAIGCVGLYYRVILLQQSDFSWLLTQAGLIWSVDAHTPLKRYEINKTQYG